MRTWVQEVARAESAWLATLGPTAFRGTLAAAYRSDPSVREAIHAEAMGALRGYISGQEQAWHVADWLRAHAYLWFDLNVARLEEAIALERCLVGALIPGCLSAFNALAAQLRPAFVGLSRLETLHRAQPEDHQTLNGSTRYWDTCARMAPLVSIDWACFDREDLFDANGRRAARWLLSKGGLRPHHVALQVGCGLGRVERHLSGQVAEVVGLDVSREMATRGAERLLGLPSVRIQRCDGRSTGLPDESVDYAFALLVFIHIHAEETRAAWIADLHRTLRPGGRFWLTLDAFRLSQEGGLDSMDHRIRRMARKAGFRSVSRSRVDDRAINSFGFEWDWRWELTK